MYDKYVICCCRCSSSVPVKMIPENLECSYLQMHPIAHAGLAFDFINYSLPVCVAMGCAVSFTVMKANKKLDVIINSIMIGNPFKIFRDDQPMFPNQVCSFAPVLKLN